MVVSIENITKVYGPKTVLNNVSLTVENTDRIGLIGANGCGKSTLLRIITGLESYESQPEPNVPRIAVTRGMTIGFLQQDSGLDRESCVLEEMQSVFAPLEALRLEIEELGSEMAQEHIHSDPALLAEKSALYSLKTAEYEAKDGYLTDVKIRKVLFGMGFGEEYFAREIGKLSGGEKTRLAIAKLLLEEPSLLILDEPTNHLDSDTVMWLEEYLSAYRGALLVVSHDRYFLDRICTSVCEIEGGRLRRFKGNYTKAVQLRDEADERQMKEYLAQQEEIARLKDFVARNLVRASTSDMAKSRIKKLESMELIEKPHIRDKSAVIRFEYDVEPPLDVLTVKGLSIAAGGREIAGKADLTVRRGEKIGIVGANGTGKSTFMRMLMRLIPYEGQVIWNKNVKLSYFDQENRQLHPSLSVIDEIHDRYRTMTDEQIRKLLGLVRITGENVFKQVGVISGGERAKLCFALMMLERGNVLLLDEPTNHLDIDTREAIEDALASYTGTMLLVSHDRYLLERVTDRIIEVSPQGTKVYDMDYHAYSEEKRKQMKEEQERRFAEKQAEKAARKEEPSHLSRKEKQEQTRRKLRAKELERLISDTEEQMRSLQEKMALPDIAADYLRMNELCTEYEQLKALCDQYTEEWLEISE